MVNYSFNTRNIHSKIGQIVTDFSTIEQVVYHSHSQILEILNLLSDIETIYLQINTVKYDADRETTNTYENLQIVFHR